MTVLPGLMSVRNAARTGSIPRRQIGSTFRFAQEDADEFVASTHRAGRDPYARTASQFAAVNRGKPVLKRRHRSADPWTVRTPEKAGLDHLAFTARQTHAFVEPSCPACGQPEQWTFYLHPGDGLWRLASGRCISC